MSSNLDFDRLATQLLPGLLRKPVLRAWLGALLTPLRQLYTTFLLYADAARLELSYNSQTLVLEGLLNDRFDPYGRRIRIQNATTVLTPLYLNFHRENQPRKFLRFAIEGPPWVFVRTYSEFSTQLDYTVVVPQVTLPANRLERKQQIQARTQRFNPATKRYTIIYPS